MKYGLTTPSAKASSGKVQRTKVMVALRGFDSKDGKDSALSGSSATTGTVATTNASGYAANRAAYASIKAAAKQKQADLLLWLSVEKGDGTYRKASAPTAFGTFTVEVSESLIPILERSPLVESVMRVEDTPMTLLGNGTYNE